MIVVYVSMTMHIICFDQFFPVFIREVLFHVNPHDATHHSIGLTMDTLDDRLAMLVSVVLSILLMAFIFT